MPPLDKPQITSSELSMIQQWKTDGFIVGEPLAPSSSGPVTYANFIKEYLDTNCVSCHSPAGAEDPMFPNFDAAKLAAKVSLNSMLSGSMPEGGSMVDTAVTDAFDKWINGELGFGEITIEEGEKISYDKQIKPYLDANCVACHSDSGSKQAPYLTTFEEAKAAAELSYWTLIAQTIPPGRAAADNEKETFRRWMIDELGLAPSEPPPPPGPDATQSSDI